MVEIRFKPADVGTVADGALTSMIKFPSGETDPPAPADGDLYFNTVEGKFKRYVESPPGWVIIDALDDITRIADDLITNAKINVAAGIEKGKLAPLEIVDADVSAIDVAKITDAVDGAGTTATKKVTGIGYDTDTEEIAIEYAEA